MVPEGTGHGSVNEAPGKVMEDGWIKLPRKAVEMFGYTAKLHAYVELKMRQDFQTKNIACSIKGIALRWGWSRGKARRFLSQFWDLENGHPTGPPTIPLADTLEGQTATFYEGQPTQDSTPNSTLDGHIPKKKIKIKNTTTPLTPLTPHWGFDEFWKTHPKKVGRLDAVKAWNRLAPEEALQMEILTALDQHKKSQQWRRDGGQFIQAPAAWLNKRRWEDELESVVARPNQESEEEPMPEQKICVTCSKPISRVVTHRGGHFYSHGGSDSDPECEGPDMVGDRWTPVVRDYFGLPPLDEDNQQERVRVK